jgi:RHS repeat-associated protein
LYYENANTAYFDGMHLYKENIGDISTYDANGNLDKSTDALGNTVDYNFNSENNLTNVVDAKNSTESNTNDSKNNLTSSTSAEGVRTAYTYDSFGNNTSTTIGNTSLFIKDSVAYTADGNYIKSTIDNSGNSNYYDMDFNTGNVNSETDAKGKVTNYSYNSQKKFTGISKSVDGDTISNSYTYEKDKLKTINHNGFDYIFNYDSIGNNTAIQVGNQTLVTNAFETKTGILQSTTFGNGQKVGYDYDTLYRVTSKSYNNSVRFNYAYDLMGNVGYKEDKVRGISHRYSYNNNNDIINIRDSNGDVIDYLYDENSNLTKIMETISAKKYTTSYEYDKDNRIKKVSLNEGTINYTYDTLNRLKQSEINTGSSKFNTIYSFEKGSTSGATTSLISEVDNNGSKIAYTYDKNNNIETITENGNSINYYYNELDELKREDNKILKKTIVYSYDKGGNILSKSEYPYTTGDLGTITKTYNYKYEDSNWKDKLTEFDGKAITYDAIGNPLTYDSWTYSWEEGRQLKSISGNGKKLTFKYDDNGVRTEKIVDGVTTKYNLVEDRVTYESNGTDNIYYSYDVEKKLESMNFNGVEYYYVRNVQGDIIGLVDKMGNLVVEYTYDSWGDLITIEGSLKDTIGVKNPYRYRGYRYDSETRLYYLQSRYYSPELGRFLNADTSEILSMTCGDLISGNLFVYCSNNPVINSDPGGYLHLGRHWWNNIKFISRAIDVLILVLPALWSLGGLMRAKAIAAKAGKAALKSLKDRSRKVIIKMYVSLVKKVATYNYRLASVIKGTSGAVINGILTAFGTSVGGLVTYLLNRIDGNRRDKYLWA